MTDLRHLVTADLALAAPTLEDVGPLHEIYADARVWTHLPSGRHRDPGATETMVRSWMRSWDEDGLGSWVVRHGSEAGPVIGHGGCTLRGEGQFWNLGYRFAPESHGHGYATLVARRAVAAAREVGPQVPVVAYLLEHNVASARVAVKSGLTLVHRAPDAGNPDPDAVRLVYADRPLTDSQLAAAVH